jgi:hypothetical protein
LVDARFLKERKGLMGRERGLCRLFPPCPPDAEGKHGSGSAVIFGDSICQGVSTKTGSYDVNSKGERKHIYCFSYSIDNARDEFSVKCSQLSDW